jgi:DNA replication protein DnaC
VEKKDNKLPEPVEFSATELPRGSKNRFGISNPPREEIERKKRFYADRLMAYGFDQRDQKSFDRLAYYLAVYYLGIATKGICLMGNTGSGKTMAMQILNKLTGVRMYTAYDLSEEWQKFGVDNRRDFWEMLRGQFIDHSTYLGDKYKPLDRLFADIIIDDVGTEPTMSDYGVKQEIMNAIIDKRYAMFKQSRGAFTHLSLNLKIRGDGPESMQGRYGKRSISRIYEMCNVIHFSSQDQRMPEGMK